MFNVKSVNEALKIIDENFCNYNLDSEIIRIEEASGRITASDIYAKEDIPGFNRSSVDGYAVIASDTFGASDSLPAQLKLAGEVRMGESPDFSILQGQAAYVPTGGELPQNTNAVVMVEYTENLDDGFIYINKPVAPGNNVVLKGDDIRSSSIVIKANHKLRAQDIGVLAAIGKREVEVKRKVKVGIISTGDEVVPVDEKLTGSKVRDINSYVLYSGLLEYGAEPKAYGIVGDCNESIRAVVEKALSECDAVLVSGGSSVGNRDETYKVINSLGTPGVIIHGIAVKPGKPTIVGKVQNKAVIGLPGHPASAYLIFRIFVYRLLDTIYGIKMRYENIINAYMEGNYPSNNGREEFLPVRLKKTDGKFIARAIFSKSGLIASLSSADGYIRIGRGTEGITSGQEVEVTLF